MPNDSGRVPATAAQVINLSLGREGNPNPREQGLYTHLNDRGITVVAAAGNRNSDVRSYPAAYSGVFAVGGPARVSARGPVGRVGGGGGRGAAPGGGGVPPPPRGGFLVLDPVVRAPRRVVVLAIPDTPA
jgi:subtilisin family serine protease